jgi:hypothetical protein
MNIEHFDGEGGTASERVGPVAQTNSEDRIRTSA